MSGSAYYNEIDPKKSAWLRELIKADAIAPGDVDERSIADVQPDDLLGYTRCHFFAGIGVWDYALRLAGWPADRPVWTGSCPCPSFSAAGKGQGFDDPRHLWPAWHRLIRECRPPVVFGEQVDAAIGHGWFDLVQTDLEAEGYAVGKAVLGACSVGAPHKRQRLYFVAESENGGLQVGRAEGVGRVERFDLRGSTGANVGNSIAEHCGSDFPVHAPSGGCGERGDAAQPGRSGHADGSGGAGELGDAAGERLTGDGSIACAEGSRSSRQRGFASETRLLAHPDGGDAEAGRLQRSGEQRQQPEDGGVVCVADASGGFFPLAQRGPQGGDGAGPDGPHDPTGPGRPGPLNGFWRDADWLRCRDGKWRPVEARTFPLASGTPARVGRLRGYGDSLTAQAAAAFVSAYMESRP